MARFDGHLLWGLWLFLTWPYRMLLRGARAVIRGIRRFRMWRANRIAQRLEARELASLRADRDALKRELSILKVDLEVAQREIECLAAVVVRDRSRVQAEGAAYNQKAAESTSIASANG